MKYIIGWMLLLDSIARAKINNDHPFLELSIGAYLALGGNLYKRP